MRSRGIDLAPFNQFDPDFVLLDALSRSEVATVLDVGANRGQFAEWLFAYGFKGAIHSFEPLPEAYAALQQATLLPPHYARIDAS